jgi:hypothetical protein
MLTETPLSFDIERQHMVRAESSQSIKSSNRRATYCFFAVTVGMPVICMIGGIVLFIGTITSK